MNQPDNGGEPTGQRILEALKPIMDPDLHRSIVDLGFIKNITVQNGSVKFDLELTTPACPVKDKLKQACIEQVSKLDGVREVTVNMTARTRSSSGPDRQILKTVKNIVAVASGKGGVGKSTVAVNLAAALQRTGAVVGILDADIYGPSVPTMVRVERQPQATADQRLTPAGGHGMKLVSMGLFVEPDQAAILRGPMVSKYVSQFLGAVDWGELDYLVIDYPPGTGDVQLTLSQQAPITGAIIVTTPQEIALVDARRAVAMFEKTRVPVLGVVETMSWFQPEPDGERYHLFGQGGGRKIADETGVPFLGGIPIDPEITAGGDSGVPIVIGRPDSPVSGAFQQIAGAAAAQLSILNVERGTYKESFKLQWQQTN